MNKFKVYRQAAGMSQQQLAAALGTQQCSVSDWETGKHEPSLKHIRGMAKIYGIGLFQMMFEEAPDNGENLQGAEESQGTDAGRTGEES